MHNDKLALVFGVIALLFLVWNFAIATQIKNYLQQRGEKVNPALMHVRIFGMVRKYREFNVSESGRQGKYYRTFWISTLLFVFFFVSGILCVL